MTTRDMRSTLLELAIEVIDKYGEHAIRTNQIVAEAGTTPPTLYHYFGNREGLVEEAQAERFLRSILSDAEFFNNELTKVKTKEDLREVVKALFSRHDKPAQVEVRWKRLNALGSAFARDSLTLRIAESHNQVVDEIAKALSPFQQSGFINQDVDLRAAVAWYNGAILGKALSNMDGSTIDVAQWEKIMNESVLHLLFGEK